LLRDVGWRGDGGDFGDFLGGVEAEAFALASPRGALAVRVGGQVRADRDHGLLGAYERAATELGVDEALGAKLVDGARRG
jgi:hypothetical protein